MSDNIKDYGEILKKLAIARADSKKAKLGDVVQAGVEGFGNFLTGQQTQRQAQKASAMKEREMGLQERGTTVNEGELNARLQSQAEIARHNKAMEDIARGQKDKTSSDKIDKDAEQLMKVAVSKISALDKEMSSAIARNSKDIYSKITPEQIIAEYDKKKEQNTDYYLDLLEKKYPDLYQTYAPIFIKSMSLKHQGKSGQLKVVSYDQPNKSVSLSERSKFIQGAISKGYTEQEAINIANQNGLK